MSITNLILDEQKRNEFAQDNSDTLKTVLGITGVAAILKRGLSKEAESLIRSGSRRNRRSNTRIGEAGLALKSSIDEAFEVRNKTNSASANQFFDELIEDASSILGRTVKEALEDTPEIAAEKEMLKRSIINEKTYLLTAVRNAVRDLNLEGEVGSSSMIVDKIDEVLRGEMNNASILSDEIKGALQAIRSNTTVTSRIDQYKKFRGLKDSSRYFSGQQRAIGVAQTLVKDKPIFSTFHEAFKASIATRSNLDPLNALDVEVPQGLRGLEKSLEDKVTQLNKRLEKYGGGISRFLVTKEHSGELASISAYVGGRGKELSYPIPILMSSVGSDQGGRLRKIHRATGSTNTPFAMPSFMPTFDELTRMSKEGMSRADVFSTLKRATPERFVQEQFFSFLEGLGANIDDVSERQLNQFTAYVRSYGESINRASLYSSTDSPVGANLASMLKLKETLTSTRMVGFGSANQLTQKELNQLPIELMQKYPDIFDAPHAGATVIRQGQVAGLGATYGVNLFLNQLDDQALPTSLNLLRGFGFKDRGTSRLTARETQFFGREELLSGIILPGDQRRSNQGGVGATHNFGKGKKIGVISFNEGLLSIDPGMAKLLAGYKNAGLGQVRGGNMAGIIFFGEGQAYSAGIAEGQAYYGGLMEVEFPIQKTVLDPENMMTGEYAYLRKLIEMQKKDKTGTRRFRLTRDQLEDAFAKYSNERGEIPLGEIDNRVVGIKKYSGLTDYLLKIEEVMEDKGRVKYHILGRPRVASERNKLFGVLGRLTSVGDPITEEMAVKAIDQSFQDFSGEASGRLTGRQIMDIYKQDFGGIMRNLIITEAKDMTKTADMFMNALYGSYRMLGGSEEALSQQYNTREQAEAFARTLYGDAYQGFDRQVNRAKLIGNAQDLLRGLVRSGVELTTEKIGLFLGPIEYLAGNKIMGLEEGDLVKNVLEPLNISYDESRLKQVLASKAAIVASSMFAGSSPQILARNMARFEPRHANILYNSMRSFFGLNSEQSIRYLNDFVLRQEGIEYSGRYLPDIAALSSGFRTDLTKKRIVDDRPFERLSQEQFDRLTVSAKTRSKYDPTKQDQFRQTLIDLLDYDNPTVLRTADFVTDQDKLERLNRIIPSGNIMLPSGRTIEGMANYQIQKGEMTENIDARVISNLKGFFEHLDELDSDPRADSRLRALGTIVQDTIDLGADAIRRSLSGSVLGSISAQGSGVILSKTKGNVNIGAVDMDNAIQQFQKHKGYTLFGDVTLFMDSMNTFMGAATKTNIIPDALDEVTERNAGRKRVQKFKQFMFGHMGEEGTVRGIGLRNPSLGMTHMMPGIGLTRFDVSKEYDIGNILDDKNKNFISEMLSEDILGQAEDTPFTTHLRSKIVSDESGVLSLDKMSSEDIYRLERTIADSDAMRSAFVAQRFGQEMNSFQSNLRTFFGGNVPSELSSINRETLSSAREVIESSNLNRAQKKELRASVGRMQGLVTEPGKSIGRLFESAYGDIMDRFHKAPGRGVGGGVLMAPTFEANIELDVGGAKTGQRSRLDLLYSVIGDFDADTYQFFHETKNVMNAAMAQRGDEMIESFTGQSARFGVIRNLVNEAFNTMGKKLGAGDMDLIKLRADQAKKEVILKNVGGLDVQFKSALLGMVENSLEIAEADRGSVREAAHLVEQLSDIAMGGGSLVNFQELGNIKAKKLPFAADIGAMLAGAMRTGLETGSTEDFEKMFQRFILDHSEALSRGATVSDVNLIGIDSPDVQEMYKRQLGKRKFDGREILQTITAGIKRAHKEGFAVMGSEGRLGRALSGYGTKSKGFFESLMAQRSLMEFGLLGDAPEQMGASRTAEENVFAALDGVTSRMSQIKSVVRKGLSGKGMAGIIGASLVGSYAIGANYSTQALSGPDKFSDMKVKNQIAERAIHNSFSQRHKDPTPQSMQTPHNIYERQILKKEMYVSKPSSIAVQGNVSSLNQGQRVLESLRSMGGRGHMSIQDNVMPRPNLADYYMRE